MNELEIFDCVLSTEPVSGKRVTKTTKRKGPQKQLRAVGVDEMLAEARGLLQEMGLKPRTVNVTQQRNVRAVVMSDGRRPDNVIAGRVYRRPRKTRSN